MRQPSGRARRPEGTEQNLAWSALIVVASVLGGLAAADVTHESTRVALLFSLLVAAIMVVALYQGLVDQRRSLNEQRGGLGPGGPVADPARAITGGGHRLSTETAPPRRQPVLPVQPGVVQLVQRADSGAWWEGHTADRSARPTGSAPAPRAADLSQFLDKALIAQCPNCGAFRIDVDSRRAAELAFGCQECRYQWTWQPGHPWPAIQVRPSARGPHR
jgi:hypothetical protein